MNYTNISADTQALDEISQLADQLTDTVDDRFDITLTTSLSDERLLKLVIMVNFILERARQNITLLAGAKAELEDKVRERTELLELVIQGSSDGVWFWHIQDERLDVSRRLAEQSGLKPSDLTHLDSWLNRLHPDDASELKTHIRQYLSGVQSRLVVQCRINDGLGHYRWVIIRGALQRDDSGAPLTLAGTQSDVTPLVAIDQASGLPNEKAFDEWLLTCIRTIPAVTRIAIVSVDRFAEVGSALSGGQLQDLRSHIRALILDSLPLTAFVAMLPSDTLVVGLTGTATDLATIRQLSNALPSPIHVEGSGLIKFTLSIGTLVLTEATNAVDSCKSALWASVRAARQQSGNSVVEFNEEIRGEQARQLRVESDVRLALQEERLHVFMQPIVDARTRRVFSFEALVRMRGHNDEWVPPGMFIPVVEQSELIAPVTERVLHQALNALKTLRHSGLVTDEVSVAVNIAPGHLLSGEVPGVVSKLLGQFDIPPAALTIEVTESALMDNLEAAVEQLTALRKLGCKIAADDFGTGYSSLEYLHTLPLDVLKMDRVFVQQIERSAKTAAIAQTVCDLAALLSLSVVAEGVETTEQADALAQMGATLLQGFYFSKPLPLLELQDWLVKYRERMAIDGE